VTDAKQLCSVSFINDLAYTRLLAALEVSARVRISSDPVYRF
jgi:hypothetical protein